MLEIKKALIFGYSHRRNDVTTSTITFIKKLLFDFIKSDRIE